RISYVNFFMYQPPEEARIFMDYLRLERAGAAGAGAPPAPPRAAAPPPPVAGPAAPVPVAAAAAPPAPAPTAWPAIRPASNAPAGGSHILADFETEAELQRFVGQEGLVATLVTAPVTHGKRAALLRFPPGGTFPNLRWEAGPAGTLQDWSGYDSLKVDILNQGQRRAQVQIKLKSGRAGAPSYTQPVIVEPGEWRTAQVKLSRVRGQGLDPAGISHLEFFVFRPAEEVRLVVDHLRLESPPQPAAGTEQAAVPPGGNADYRLAVSSSLRKLFPDEASAVQHLPGAALLSAAGREYEAFQVVIAPLTKDLENVTVALEDLVEAKTGHRLDRGNLTWRLVGNVQTKKPYYQVERVGWWPDPLVPVKSFTAKKGAVTSVWVTASVPPGTPAGTYGGRVTVVPGNAPRASLDVRLRVWGFDLPVTGALKTAFNFYPDRMAQWHPRRMGESLEAWRGRIGQLVQTYYLAMLRHRISPVVYADPLGPDFDRTLEPLLRNGLTAFAIGPYGAAHANWPEGAGAEAQVVQRYRAEAEALQKKGLLDKAYIYTWDEPVVGNPDMAHVTALVHRGDPRLKNLVTFYHPFQPAEHAAWTKDVDIWVPRINRYEPALYQPIQKAGKEVWLYVAGVSEPFPTLVLDFPSMAYRIIPWMLWKYQITGLLYWCVNFWRVNPWHDTMTYPDQNGNGSLFYPGEDGPVESIRLEVLRDGIEDYEYFALLRRLASSLPGGGKCGDPAAVRRETQALLAVGPDIVRNLGEYTDDLRAIQARREKLGEAVEHLARCVGGRDGNASGVKG
ncbi:MAG TPA: glycoside hydrolase domain-containing protein, partial [Candidatus Methylomirabilis sp.]